MNLNQLVATAAVGCALGAAGIALGAGTASAAPPCPPGVQCQGGPGGGPPGDRGGPPPGDRGGPPPGDRGPGGGPGDRDPVAVPATMIGARPAILRTTTGAVGSTMLRGATACRRGAGVDHRRCEDRSTAASCLGPASTPGQLLGLRRATGVGSGLQPVGLLLLRDLDSASGPLTDHPARRPPRILRGGRQHFTAASNGSAGA